MREKDRAYKDLQKVMRGSPLENGVWLIPRPIYRPDKRTLAEAWILLPTIISEAIRHLLVEHI